MEKFSNKRAEQMGDIEKKLLREDDAREVLLGLFDKLADDYDLVEKVIESLKKNDSLTNDQKERVREIDDAYAGALNEWIEENTPPQKYN